jgi:signal transduction histidine kinase
VRVRIARAEANDGVVITVSDSGVGIADRDMGTALSRFGRIGHASLAAPPGTGLGLPLVKELVELHGGILTISSEVGAGTDVRIEFPPERGLWHTPDAATD